ncbi:5'-nucleotidase C-terminal domain-containing protein [Formosa sp. S-31]|uniref:5'-nucleotidase C-terminal domain-containing protein n=1 Tax=Formosa sp. S-31 TaxID=2790949 RepID=UPI003EBB6954
MNFKHLIFGFLALTFLGCKSDKFKLVKIEGNQIEISDSLKLDQDLSDFIKPYHDHLKKELDSVLAYSPQTYTKDDGEYNTAIGNLIADIIYEEGNPVFKSRTGHDIDLVILNHGSIRAPISKGNITLSTAYEIMPFENNIVVVAVKGKNIIDATRYLSKSKKAHPISKLKLAINSNQDILEASINGKNIDQEKTYYVATNDYLYNGGDHMTFFKPNDSAYILHYKVRNAMIDYFTKADTINPVIDNRFIKIN